MNMNKKTLYAQQYSILNHQKIFICCVEVVRKIRAQTATQSGCSWGLERGTDWA